jgi:MYXO-CTERM domain-containing protein
MRPSSLLAVGPVLLCASGAAWAQVGTGWVPYDPPSVIHLDGSNGIESYPGTSTNLKNEGATFTNEGGIETFALFDPISNRAERRIQNTYLTGKRQFEGEVRVSPPTNDESVMQVFGGNSGATTQMIRAYNDGGGTLRKVPGSVVLAENIHGVWIKVNVIHDVGGNFVKTYINGKLISTGDGEATNAGNDGWYHKYGCYGSLRTGSAKVEWRNVKHFRDGEPPPGNGGGPPGSGGAGGTADASPPADSGTAPRDAGVDRAPAAEAGAGSGGGGGGSGNGGSGGGGAGGGGSGSGGSSGSTGSGGGSTASGGSTGSGGGSGSGGAPGSGGRSASGGSSGKGGAGGDQGEGGASPADPPSAGGCACRTGGQANAGLALPAALAALALAMRRRRRR